MHTQRVVYEERAFFIHHNGDWSGDVIIVESDGTPEGKELIRLPGRIFRICGRHAALDEAISALEGLYLSPDGT